MPDPGMAQNPFPELSIIHYQFTHCRHKLQWVIFMQELNAQAARVWKRLALGQAYTKPKPQPKRSVPNPQPFDPNIYYLLFILYYLFFNPGPPILLCHSEAKPKNPCLWLLMKTVWSCEYRVMSLELWVMSWGVYFLRKYIPPRGIKIFRRKLLKTDWLSGFQGL